MGLRAWRSFLDPLRAEINLLRKCKLDGKVWNSTWSARTLAFRVRIWSIAKVHGLPTALDRLFILSCTASTINSIRYMNPQNSTTLYRPYRIPDSYQGYCTDKWCNSKIKRGTFNMKGLNVKNYLLSSEQFSRYFIKILRFVYDLNVPMYRGYFIHPLLSYIYHYYYMLYVYSIRMFILYNFIV